jgi:hypothetical protein
MEVLPENWPKNVTFSNTLKWAEGMRVKPAKLNNQIAWIYENNFKKNTLLLNGTMLQRMKVVNGHLKQRTI